MSLGGTDGEASRVTFLGSCGRGNQIDLRYLYVIVTQDQ